MKQEAQDQIRRVAQILNRNRTWDEPTNYAMYLQLNKIWLMIECLN